MRIIQFFIRLYPGNSSKVLLNIRSHRENILFILLISDYIWINRYYIFRKKPNNIIIRVINRHIEERDRNETWKKCEAHEEKKNRKNSYS